MTGRKRQNLAPSSLSLYYRPKTTAAGTTTADVGPAPAPATTTTTATTKLDATIDGSININKNNHENTSSTVTPTSIDEKEMMEGTSAVASVAAGGELSSSTNKYFTKQKNRSSPIPQQRRGRMSFLRDSLSRNRKPPPIDQKNQRFGKKRDQHQQSDEEFSSEKENESSDCQDAGHQESKVRTVAGTNGSIIDNRQNLRMKSNSTNIRSTNNSNGAIRERTKRSSFRFLRRLSAPGRYHSPSSSSNGMQSSQEPQSKNGNDESSTRLMQKTRVIPRISFPKKIRRQQKDDEDSKKRDDMDSVNEYSPQFECATAILQHSYLERICGGGYTDADESGTATVPYSSANDNVGKSNNNNGNNNASKNSSSWNAGISEDPTVQESIECIFASQLQDGLNLWDDDDSDGGDASDNHNNIGHQSTADMFNSAVSSSSSSEHIISPAELQQSRLNRYDRKGSASFSMKQTKKRYEQASLVYVGTFDPTMHDDDGTNFDDKPHDVSLCHTASSIPTDPLPCHCSKSYLPSVHPKNWPQAPVLLRPTPGSGTRIKCIRYSKDSQHDPIWVPGSHLSWPERIARQWGKPVPEQPHYACCERCAILPINNGNEETGKSLVVDFESDLFEGSLLLRLRHSNGTTPEPYDDTKGYFKGVNRRYQACVRGRFKKNIPLTEMVTGFRFERKCGKLPAKWILRGGLKVISFFAPQLDAKLEGEHPHSLTPLGSTPQSISVDCHSTDRSAVNMLDEQREEPVESHRTLLGESFSAPTSLQRAKLRKKAFDKLYVQQNKSLQSDPSKVYTFEFLQHLFNFQDFSIELGSMLGSVHLEEILDGQPLQIMAAHGDVPIWSFDVWHECLWEKASQLHSQE